MTMIHQNMVIWCFEEGGSDFLIYTKSCMSHVKPWGCWVGVESGAYEEMVGEGIGVGGPQASAELT